MLHTNASVYVEKRLEDAKKDRIALVEHNASEAVELQKKAQEAASEAEKAAAAAVAARKALEDKRAARTATAAERAGKKAAAGKAPKGAAENASVGPAQEAAAGADAKQPQHVGAVDLKSAVPVDLTLDSDSNDEAEIEKLERRVLISERAHNIAAAAAEGAQAAVVHGHGASEPSIPYVVPAAAEAPGGPEVPTFSLSDGRILEGLAVAVAVSLVRSRKLFECSSSETIAMLIDTAGATIIVASVGSNGLQMDVYHVPALQPRAAGSQEIKPDPPETSFLVDCMLDSILDRKKSSRLRTTLTFKVDRASSEEVVHIHAIAECLTQTHLLWVTGLDTTFPAWQNLDEMSNQPEADRKFEINSMTVLPGVTVGESAESRVLPIVPALAVLYAIAEGYGPRDIGLLSTLPPIETLTLRKSGSTFNFLQLSVPPNLGSGAQRLAYSDATLLGWVHHLTGGNNVVGCAPNPPGVCVRFVLGRQCCTHWVNYAFQNGFVADNPDAIKFTNTDPVFELAVFRRTPATSSAIAPPEISATTSSVAGSFGAYLEKTETSRKNLQNSYEGLITSVAQFATELVFLIDKDWALMMGSTVSVCPAERRMYLVFKNLPFDGKTSRQPGSVARMHTGIMNKYIGVLAPNSDQQSYLMSLSADERVYVREHALVMVEFMAQSCYLLPEIFPVPVTSVDCEPISELRRLCGMLAHLWTANTTTAAGSSHMVDEQKRILTASIRACLDGNDNYGPGFRRFLDFGFNTCVYPAYPSILCVLTSRQKKSKSKAAVVMMEKRAPTLLELIEMSSAFAKLQRNATSYPTAETELAVTGALVVGRMYIGSGLRPQSGGGMEVVLVDKCVALGTNTNQQARTEPAKTIKVTLIGLADADSSVSFALPNTWLEENIVPEGEYVVMEVLTQFNHAFVADSPDSTPHIAGIVFISNSSWDRCVKGSLVGKRLSSLETWMGRSSLQSKMIERDVKCDKLNVCDGQFPFSWISIPRILNLIKMGGGDINAQWKRGNSVISGLICDRN